MVTLVLYIPKRERELAPADLRLPPPFPPPLPPFPPPFPPFGLPLPSFGGGGFGGAGFGGGPDLFGSYAVGRLGPVLLYCKYRVIGRYGIRWCCVRMQEGIEKYTWR
jgi:hypothetical protein